MELAYCGLCCQECPVYEATVTDDDALRAKLAQEYAVPGFAPGPEDMTCRGCHSDTPCLVMCSQCPMRQCAMERGADNCGLCPDYPCATVEERIPTDAPHRLRLEELHRAAAREYLID